MAFTIFGVASGVGGLLALLLPETLGSPLPDTFQDIEVIPRYFPSSVPRLQLQFFNSHFHTVSLAVRLSFIIVLAKTIILLDRPLKKCTCLFSLPM